MNKDVAEIFDHLGFAASAPLLEAFNPADLDPDVQWMIELLFRLEEESIEGDFSSLSTDFYKAHISGEFNGIEETVAWVRGRLPRGVFLQTGPIARNCLGV